MYFNNYARNVRYFIDSIELFFLTQFLYFAFYPIISFFPPSLFNNNDLCTIKYGKTEPQGTEK